MARLVSSPWAEIGEWELRQFGGILQVSQSWLI